MTRKDKIMKDKIGKILLKLTTSNDIDGKEFMFISGCMWALVALKNNPELTYEELNQTYGIENWGE